MRSELTTRAVGAEALGRILREVGVDAFVDELIDVTHTAMAEHDPERCQTLVRSGFHYVKPELGLIEWMPAIEVGRVVAVKMVAYHPTNPVQRNLPSVLGTTSVYDVTSGQLLGLVEATTLTALRTGVASALATRALSPDAPITLGLIGTGAQAVTQAHAISRVRPIERILATDTNGDVAATLAHRLDFMNLPSDVEIELLADADVVAGSVDVLCTATSVGIHEGPVFADAQVRPHLHINAVGADFPGKVEIPVSLLERSLVVPDDRDQCIAEGECQQLNDAEIGPELAALLADPDHFAEHRDQLTTFDSTGWSLEDLIAAELVLHHAERLGVGEQIAVQGTAGDPYDPLELLR